MTANSVDYMRSWRERNRETYQKGQRSRHLVRTYGISHERYEEMSAHQDGVCAICCLPETKVMKGTACSLAVDHDHETGKVRGLLCDKCNVALGKLGDSPENLRRAADYLEAHR